MRRGDEIEAVPFREGMIISFRPLEILPFVAERPEVYFDMCPSYQMRIRSESPIIIEDLINL